MSDTKPVTITLGLSSCPNDTFIFHALLHGLVKPDYPAEIIFEPYMADVERLNLKACEGDLDVTKLSVGVLPHALARYRALSSGAALGWGCGPLVVAGKPPDARELEYAKIAIPGRNTTARMLLDLHGGFGGERIEMNFADIMDAVKSGAVDAGLIIHEGRFTYQNLGLVKVIDLGEWWEGAYHLPLPLGAIAIRRDVPRELALAIQKAIADSVDYAWANPEASREYIRENAQELSEEVAKAHIKTFVTNFSRDLGETGRGAIRKLVEKSMKDGVVTVLYDDMFVEC